MWIIERLLYFLHWCEIETRKYLRRTKPSGKAEAVKDQGVLIRQGGQEILKS